MSHSNLWGSLAKCYEVKISNASLLLAAIIGLHRGTGSQTKFKVREEFDGSWKSSCLWATQRAVLQATAWEGKKIFPLLAISYCRETQVLFWVPCLWHHPAATAHFCMCRVNNWVPLVCAECCSFAFKYKAEPCTSSYQQAQIVDRGCNSFPASLKIDCLYIRDYCKVQTRPFLFG